MKLKIISMIQPLDGVIPGFEELGKVKGEPRVLQLAPNMPPLAVVYQCEHGEVVVPCAVGHETSRIVVPGPNVQVDI